jgi:hypothetical protein
MPTVARSDPATPTVAPISSRALALTGPAVRPRAADRVSVAGGVPQAEGHGWFMTGMYIMTLPLTLPLKLGMTIMWAPVSWIIGPRTKQTS